MGTGHCGQQREGPPAGQGPKSRLGREASGKEGQRGSSPNASPLTPGYVTSSCAMRRTQASTLQGPQRSHWSQYRWPSGQRSGAGASSCVWRLISLGVWTQRGDLTVPGVGRSPRHGRGGPGTRRKGSLAQLRRRCLRLEMSRPPPSRGQGSTQGLPCGPGFVKARRPRSQGLPQRAR